jgi:hypothetical protein
MAALYGSWQAIMHPSRINKYVSMAIVGGNSEASLYGAD